MKHLLLIFLTFVSVNMVFAQDEIYINPQSEEMEQAIMDTANYNSDAEYYTEADYVEGELEVKNESEEGLVYGEEIWEEKEAEKKRRRRQNAEFAAEIIVDVFIQTAFFVATFWLQ